MASHFLKNVNQSSRSNFQKLSNVKKLTGNEEEVVINDQSKTDQSDQSKTIVQIRKIDKNKNYRKKILRAAKPANAMFDLEQKPLRRQTMGNNQDQQAKEVNPQDKYQSEAMFFKTLAKFSEDLKETRMRQDNQETGR